MSRDERDAADGATAAPDGDATATAHRNRSRRDWLRGVGALGSIALAGCLGGGAVDESGDDGESGTESDGSNATDDGGGGDDDDGGDDGDEVHPEYDTREVVVETPDGDRLGSVTAAVADTRDLRYTGLSDTESLPEDRGMLFVYDSVGDHTFVMREMDFGIDIVYADGDGVITGVHHAPAPGPDEDGESQRYPGRGQYVLEVTYKWTADRDVGVGDVLAFDPVEPSD